MRVRPFDIFLMIRLTISDALRHAGMVDPRLNALASADAVSAMAAGLLELAGGSSPLAGQLQHAITSPGASTPASVAGATTTASQAARVSNPFNMSERNGIRFYKQLAVTPAKPGPQANVALRYQSTNPNKKRKQRAKVHGSNTFEEDIDPEDEYVASEEETPDPESNKRRKAAEVEKLRSRVTEMQVDLDQLQRFEEEEKAKTEGMDVSPKSVCRNLFADAQ